MADQDWHRTFLPDGPFECLNQCHGSSTSSAKPHPEKDRRNDPAWLHMDTEPVTPNPPRPPKPYSIYQKRYKAFQFNGHSTTDLCIVGKIGQDFETYATD